MASPSCHRKYLIDHHGIVHTLPVRPVPDDRIQEMPVISSLEDGLRDQKDLINRQEEEIALLQQDMKEKADEIRVLVMMLSRPIIMDNDKKDNKIRLLDNLLSRSMAVLRSLRKVATTTLSISDIISIDIWGHEDGQEEIKGREEIKHPDREEEEVKVKQEEGFVTPPRKSTTSSTSKSPRSRIDTPSPPQSLPYTGGKWKLAKEIYTTICRIEQERGQNYERFFEPFCGMMSIGLLASQDGRRVLASDANPDIIRFWQSLKEGWRPPSNLRMSKQRYEEFKSMEEGSDPLRSFVGIVYAFNNSPFHSYAKARKSGTLQTYLDRMENITPLLHSITVLDPARSYTEIDPAPCNQLIYCDPPYAYSQSTVSNPYLSSFDHDVFWDTMRKWSVDNLVFVSERDAPDDFEVVWEKIVKRHQVNWQVDRLFTMKLF